MKLVKVKNYDQMSEQACDIVLDRINNLKKPVLGLATGSTPEGLYKQLINKYTNKETSFNNVTTFNLDEYIGLSHSHPNSYYTYMNEHLFNYIDIDSKNVNIPNGNVSDILKECSDYEKVISEHGSIDVQLLGLGSNGHIGFNEPGTPFSSRTHIVQLSESTRQANARFFESVDEVPTKAITMGIRTIMESNEIVVLVSGLKKSMALANLINGEVSEEFPASILQKHKNVTIIADEPALSKL
ncbi:glucosamine-6-phosphate deaminase [Virgibacillus sp. DJP39]|uniref:glucosamine-6-phosphate deaminase n=1 Tax=Virgibacillus sp. DJP39 TaxID=3409790 RepID=UPI003BB73CE1